MHYVPRLNLPYCDADMDAILNDALRVIEELGIACEDEAVIDRLTAEPGVRHAAGRLRFAPEVVREHVDDVRRRSRATREDEPPFEALASWACLNIADPESGRVRPPTTEDAVRMTRLMDARGCHDWPIPVIPADINRRHSTLVCEYIGLKHSRRLGGFMPGIDADEIEFLIAMNRAVGRTFRLVEQVSISPLRFNGHGMAMALGFAGRDDVDVLLTGAIPSVGSTTPFPVRSAVVENVAETLALSLAVKRLGFGRGGFGVGLQACDFRYANLVFGGPEWMLYDLVSRQMGEFLNGRIPRFGAFRAMARMPDAQAAAERMASVLWQALLGARRFRAIGQLAIDEVFSPQQVIIDDEILARVARVLRGLDPLAADADAVADIAAGLQDGTYMGLPATARDFRDFCHFPRLFHRYNVGHWRSVGMPTVLDEAWASAQEQIDACDFELPPHQLDELDRVYREALRAVR